MLPKWHVFLGLVFSLVLWAFFPDIRWYFILVLFLSSVLIDFDHYMTFIWKKGSWSLPDAFDYYIKQIDTIISERKRGIIRKGDFIIFHTIEFHAVVLALGFLYPVFLYVLAGMVFHSLSDLVYLTYEGYVYRREFFLTNWIRMKLKEKRVQKIKQIERIKVKL